MTLCELASITFIIQKEKKVNLKATLIINRNDSSCLNCGKGAHLKEKSHNSWLGYENPYDKPGCGILWENVTSHYEGMEDFIKAIRPDLTFVSYRDILLAEANQKKLS